jgi:hypothetical protein
MWCYVVWWKDLFFSITTLRSSKISQRFGRTYRLHLQARRVSRVGNQHKHEAISASASFLLLLVFCPEDGGDMIFRNVGRSPNYVALQPRQPYSLYVVTAVIKSNSTNIKSTDPLLNNPKVKTQILTNVTTEMNSPPSDNTVLHTWLGDMLKTAITKLLVRSVSYWEEYNFVLLTYYSQQMNIGILSPLCSLYPDGCGHNRIVLFQWTGLVGPTELGKSATVWTILLAAWMQSGLRWVTSALFHIPATVPT